MDASKAPAEWLDLKALCQHACVSERTLRSWIHAPENPLPASCVGKKILVRRRVFDDWLERHAVKSLASGSIGRMVDEILEEVTR